MKSPQCKPYFLEKDRKLSPREQEYDKDVHSRHLV